jgi:nucleotidyltransferase substrate binding protein (TIGR01987 family)
MALDLSSLRAAVHALEESTGVLQELDDDDKVSAALRNTVRAGVIQHFEFTYELSWKFMKRWLEAEGGRSDVSGLPRRELFRLGAEVGLIRDVSAWFDFHTARNETSHTYDADVAIAVLEAAVQFAACARALLEELERRNA